MDLITIVDIAEIVGAVVVISGVVFGVIQVRHYQQQRHDVAAVQLVNSFQNPEFNKSLRNVWSIPDAATWQELQACGNGWQEAAFQVGMTMETMGVLVYRRIVPLAILDELMGDAILLLWRKLQPWVQQLRIEQKRNSAYEWFQWLAERLAERERRTEMGAHLKYRNWRP
jgi:hypothetical protein